MRLPQRDLLAGNDPFVGNATADVQTGLYDGVPSDPTVLVRPWATSDCSSVWVWPAIGQAYGIAPNSGAAWLPCHGLFGSGA